MAGAVWAEQVRDTRLPGVVQRRLDSCAGWRLRRYAAPLQPLVWLATGTPPPRIGYGPGPLIALQGTTQRNTKRAAGAATGGGFLLWIGMSLRLSSAQQLLPVSSPSRIKIYMNALPMIRWPPGGNDGW